MVKDPARWVAPERGGPSRKRRPLRIAGAGHKNAGASAPTTDNRNTLKEIAAQRPNNSGTLAQMTPAGRLVPGPVGQRGAGKERGKSASGSAKKRRTLKERVSSGKECALGKSGSFSTGRCGVSPQKGSDETA